MKLKVLLSALIISLASCSDDKSDEPQPGQTTTPESGTDDSGTPPSTDSHVQITVLDYSPAPGQFINQIPEYETGDTRETIIAKATELLNNGDMISLGAWGGSVTMKLETSIRNISGQKDFRIEGNAVYANASTETVRYGSAEPGIIMVMHDSNRNGIADDTWYEIKGDRTTEATEINVTYHRPADNASDSEYIYWEASDGNTGYINRNAGYHTQDFFPMWLDNTGTMTFSGKRLPDNGNFNETTNKFDLISYNGYADSHPNSADASAIDIDDAIDRNGNQVTLPSVEFIKVYTAVLQANGPLGECSTEVAGIEKLNQ